jgi:redox-sensitive bicupin YhaK (pirin superfamily)
MDPHARWELPPATHGTSRVLYFFRGDELRVDAHPIPAYHGARIRGDAAPTIENGPEEAQILLLGGKPIAEPVTQYGPFVMTTRAEIQQAMIDYQRTRFGGWPWPSDDPVHGPTEARFARHANGRVERKV